MFNRMNPLVILAILASLSITGLCESRVKLHKELVHIQTSTQKGFIDATGQPGAIESSSPVVASIENISTSSKANIAVSKDGSFKATIAATPEHKIRIWARNQDGKRSYGTFSIMTSVPPATPKPAETPPGDHPPAITPPTPVKTPAQNSDSSATLTTLKPATITSPPALTQFEADAPEPENMKLAVIINVVNLDTGQIVAAKRIAGVTRVKPGQDAFFKIIVTKIIDRCTNIIKSEIKQPLFSTNKKNTAPPEISKTPLSTRTTDTKIIEKPQK